MHHDHAVASEDEDDQPLVRPATRKEPLEERLDPATDDGDLAPLVPPRPPRPSPVAPLRRRKGPPVWHDPTSTLEQEVTGISRERSSDI